MTREEKDLLVKDLCARLPYRVKINIPELFSSVKTNIEILNEIFQGDDEKFRYNSSGMLIDYCKPYLFPMSSMTEEQKKEWQSLMISGPYGILYHTIYSFDYLYKNHIDFRGLIKKDLAIDATELNIY